MKIFASKRIQLGITLSLCLAIIAAGSIAWISATQKALNAFSFSPEGVNLHDDFNDPNKDVYVENSGTEPLLVRVKLREFTEIGRNDVKIPSLGEEKDPSTWHDHDGVNKVDKCSVAHNGEYIHDYWYWLMGGMTEVKDSKNKELPVSVMEDGQKWYIPANSDAMDAGSYGADDDGVKDAAVKASIGDKKIAENGLPSTLTNYADYAALLTDIALDTSDSEGVKLSKLQADLADAKEALDNIIETATSGTTNSSIEAKRGDLYEAQMALNDFTMENFGVQQTRKAEVLTMEEWLTGNGTDRGPKATGDYWVVNPDDGWFYWASPLEAGEATGLLLDAVLGSEALKDERKRFYYGIDVIMQAVTVEDAYQFWAPDNDDATLEIREYGKAGVDSVALLGEVAKKIDPQFRDHIDIAPASAAIKPVGLSATRAGIATAEEIEKGKYWYQTGDIWKYYDGRWLYDGNDWTLDDEVYPFDPSGWFLSAGEWHYLDEYWFFNGIEWIELKERAASSQAEESTVAQSPPPPPPPQSVATESSEESSVPVESGESSGEAEETAASGEDSSTAAENPEESGETRLEP